MTYNNFQQSSTHQHSSIQLFKNLIVSLSIAVFLLLVGTQFHLSYAADDYAANNTVKVYKSPTCGCCRKWVTHLKNNGFKVESVNTNRMNSVKKRLGVPGNLQSCHTAVVNGYVIEGHVPAKDIKNLLNQKSKVVGLAVPGMPAGSPGMEWIKKDKYSVISFDKNGKTKVVANY